MRAASKGVETADCAPAATRSNTAQESTAQQTQKTHSPPAATGEGCTHTYTATPSPQRRADAHGYRWRPKGLSTPSALSMVQVRGLWLVFCIQLPPRPRGCRAPGAVVFSLPSEPSLGPRLFVAFGGSSATVTLPEPSAWSSARSLRWFLGYRNVFFCSIDTASGAYLGFVSKLCGGRRVDQGMQCRCAWGPQTLSAISTGEGPREHGPHRMIRQAGHEGCQQKCVEAAATHPQRHAPTRHKKRAYSFKRRLPTR